MLYKRAKHHEEDCPRSTSRAANDVIAFAQAVKDPQGTPGGGLTADNGITGATSADSVNNPGTNDEMTISGNPGPVESQAICRVS